MIMLSRAVVTIALSVLVLIPIRAEGQTIAQIIDSTGDGAGNVFSGGQGITVDGLGNVYVVGRWTANVFRITLGGVITEIIDSSGDGTGNILSHPFGIGLDGTGNVYVTGDVSENVFRITPGGVITEIIDSTGDGAGNALKEPHSVVADHAGGNVYVTGADSSNAFKVTIGTCQGGANASEPCSRLANCPDQGPGTSCTGTITEIIDSTGDGAGNGLVRARAIALDGSGNVYVTGVGSSNAFKITPGGTITEIIDSTGDGAGNNLSAAPSVAVDGAGNVYVAGMYSDNAFKITPGGVITEIIDSTGDGAGNGLNSCEGIALDGSGNVYVAGMYSDNAFEITPAGVITEIIDSTGDGAGNNLAHSRHIAVDIGGNVYVSGVSSDNAFKIGSPHPVPGGSQGAPILPTDPASCDTCTLAAARAACLACLSAAGPCFAFCDVPTVFPPWVDPPLALGYEYRITSDSLFTGIVDFPVGFNDPFTVSADGTQLTGSFGPGDSADFGSGASRFTVTGISPPVDPTQPDAFPLRVSFNTSSASFTMRPLTCEDEPTSGCNESWLGARLIAKEKTLGKEKLFAKFLRGPELEQADLGSPLSLGGTAYSLCIYNDDDQLVGSLGVDRAGDACGGRDCWKPTGGAPPNGTGFRYKDSALASDGVQLAKLRGSDAGKSSLFFKGRNNERKGQTGLPTGIAAGLEGATSATLQLVRHDTSECFGVTLTEIIRADADFFKAKK
jgi:hypothetical protein